MFKYFTSKGTRRFIDILDDLIRSYNSSYHRSIKMTPLEVNDSKTQDVFRNLYGSDNLLELVKKDEEKERPRFKLGEKVRLKYELGVFDKAFYPNWSEQIYTVHAVDQSGERNRYTIREYDGSNIIKRRYYEEELQSVLETIHRIEKVLKRRVVTGVTSYFVKWLGYPSRYNSWIQAEEIQRLS